MAQKRMFDRAIIDTDKFMDLGMTSKAMYFLLGMEADDEGFVSYKKVLRIHGGNEDDVKVLVAKGFLLSFPSGVVVVTDWNVNNYLDKNRIRKTEYQAEKKLLYLTPEKRYGFNNGSTSIEERSIEYTTEQSSGSELRIVSDLDEEDKRKTAPKYPNAPAVLKLFSIIGNVPANWKINTAQLKACENLFKERGLEKIESALEFYSEMRDVEFCPQITTPFDLDSKWTKLGQFKLKQ